MTKSRAGFATDESRYIHDDGTVHVFVTKYRFSARPYLRDKLKDKINSIYNLVPGRFVAFLRSVAIY